MEWIFVSRCLVCQSHGVKLCRGVRAKMSTKGTNGGCRAAWAGTRQTERFHATMEKTNAANGPRSAIIPKTVRSERCRGVRAKTDTMNPSCSVRTPGRSGTWSPSYKLICSIHSRRLLWPLMKGDMKCFEVTKNYPFTDKNWHGKIALKEALCTCLFVLFQRQAPWVISFQNNALDIHLHRYFYLLVYCNTEGR